MFIGTKQEIWEIKENQILNRLIKYTYLFDPLLSQKTTIPSKVLFDLVQTLADENFELAMEIGDCRMQKHEQDSLTVFFFLADTGGSTDAFDGSVRSVKKKM